MTEAIFARTQSIDNYRILETGDADLMKIGTQHLGNMDVIVVDPVADYARLLEKLFNFPKIRALFAGGFRLRFDAMCAVTGPYATEILENRLGAAKGTVLWRKDDFKGVTPRFQTSASPMVAGGLCVAQLGSESGGIVAYELGTGDEKWRWMGDGPAYASPVLLTLGGEKYVVAVTDKKVVALTLADGKLAWETPFIVQGRGNNSATPIVDGQRIIYAGSGRGATAVKMQKEGDAFVAQELWKNLDNSVQYNSPVLKGELVFGISAKNDFFCLDAKDGKTVWVAPFAKEQAAATVGNPPSTPSTNADSSVAPGGQPGGPPTGGPGGGRGGRGGGGGGGGYGSIVDAGSVLLALTPASQLVVFEPSGKEFKELARIKVADTPTYAYPVVSGNRIFVKDQNSVTLWTVE